MSIDFPNNPSENDIYTLGLKSWVWNGTYWQSFSSAISRVQEIRCTIDGRDNVIVPKSADTFVEINGDIINASFVGDTIGYITCEITRLRGVTGATMGDISIADAKTNRLTDLSSWDNVDLLQGDLLNFSFSGITNMTNATITLKVVDL